MKMNIKIVFILTICIGITSSRRRKIIPQVQKPTTLAMVQNLATPELTVKGREMKCVQKRQSYFTEELINPPPALELPSGVGYFPSALPFVAKCFDPEFDPYVKWADLPIAECMTIATPLDINYEYLAKSIIL